MQGNMTYETVNFGERVPIVIAKVQVARTGAFGEAG
jgi:hypothetical protein